LLYFKEDPQIIYTTNPFIKKQRKNKEEQKAAES